MRTSRGLVVVATLLSVTVVGCASKPPPLVEPQGPHFSLLSWNVNWGGAGWQEALATVTEVDADIVLLQETNPAWEAVIRQSLSARYPHMHFDQAGGAGGMAVLTKEPLIAQELIEPTAGWFGAWVATAPTPLGPVQLLNVHLRPAISERGSATLSAYIDTKNVRVDEVKGFAAHFDATQPLIVAGDFNEGDGGRAIAWLCREMKLRNALPSRGVSDPTWRWNVAGISIYQRLDHVLFSPQLQCVDARVLRRGASDHFPVLATFVAGDRDRNRAGTARLAEGVAGR